MTDTEFTLDAPAFDLASTIECGQLFLWERAGDAYRVFTRGAVIQLQRDGPRLRIRGTDPVTARSFLSLDHPIDRIRRDLSRDRKLRPIVDAFSGLRVLRQDPYGCLLGFLLSICSNVPRIRMNLRAVAERFGRRVDGFPLPPEPSISLEEGELRRLGVGFRAPYLVSAQRLCKTGLLDRITGLSDEAAREELMRVDGVAEKVADCVLLFAFGRLSCFPIDVWIRRTMRELYFSGKRVTDADIRRLARERFGTWAGYAQQYLYAWARKRAGRW